MHKYTVQEVASKIDHAVLKPDQTEADVRENAAMCIARGVASLCVRPCDVKLAAELLKDSPVMVSCVLSFPHGADATPTKLFQAQQAISDGVQEIDMVMNIGQFLSGNLDVVLDDIKAVVDTAHARGVAVKVIQESAYLTLEQVALACELSLAAGADFVKTSTGFAPSSATPEIIDVMVRTVGGKMGIKASGGIRTWEQAIGYLEQGATRLGIGATAAVLDGGIGGGEY
ncbi:MAG: deoxyribose-phosphate aldolase [Kiritimatiellales bacterium]|nr:deoxyribose-phosphate aldolase [Kiritimatiellales bacterium]MCF7863464.1 deoxyribose-phosphate aldolase [Kiritimatiellales bacterium]